MADYSASVNHLGFSGYVATSGRNGNQRKAVPGYLCTNLWNGAASSGNDFKQRTWILYRIIDQCNFYDRGEFYNRKKLKEESINKRMVILIRIKARGK